MHCKTHKWSVQMKPAPLSKPVTAWCYISFLFHHETTPHTPSRKKSTQRDKVPRFQMTECPLKIKLTIKAHKEIKFHDFKWPNLSFYKKTPHNLHRREMKLTSQSEPETFETKMTASIWFWCKIKAQTRFNSYFNTTAQNMRTFSVWTCFFYHDAVMLNKNK